MTSHAQNLNSSEIHSAEDDVDNKHTEAVMYHKIKSLVSGFDIDPFGLDFSVTACYVMVLTEAHYENAEEKIVEHQLLKSRFDQLGLLKTIWIFRTSAMYVFCVYMGYLCEGFEVSFSES